MLPLPEMAGCKGIAQHGPFNASEFFPLYEMVIGGSQQADFSIGRQLNRQLNKLYPELIVSAVKGDGVLGGYGK